LTGEEADSVIDLMEVLNEQYIHWLSWGFEDNWQPKEKGEPEISE
jgi:hypothetical protein